MSGVTFSGLATGLDTASIVSQLVELKRQPIYRLENRKKGFQSQITALGTLKTKLLALQEAANNLNSANEFSSLKASTSDEDYVKVSADSNAAPGLYDITVVDLATTQKSVSQGYDSLNDSVGNGIMSITVDGETTDLNLTGYNSIESLKNLINDEVAGVSASIINDGSGSGAYHLVLSGSEAGTANAFSVDVSGLSGGTTPILTTEQPATDAELLIDGMTVIASSNNADDVISGLTLELLQEGQQVTVRVETDTEGIGENVKGLVDAYNDLLGFIETQSANDGDLRSNPTLRAVASRIESIFSTRLEGGQGSITTFSQVGITRGDGRQLNWDEDDFAEALGDNFGAVRDLFIEREGNLGKTYLIDTAIENMTDSIDGLFKISTDALNKKIDYTDASIDRYERSVDAYRTTMERKFTAMEMMVSQLQAQGNYLTGIGGY